MSVTGGDYVCIFICYCYVIDMLLSRYSLEGATTPNGTDVTRHNFDAQVSWRDMVETYLHVLFWVDFLYILCTVQCLRWRPRCSTFGPRCLGGNAAATFAPPPPTFIAS